MNSRIEYLSRKNKGKSMLPQHIKMLSEVLEKQVNSSRFLDLEKSDKIRSLFFEASKKSIQEGSSHTILVKDIDDQKVIEKNLSDFRMQDILIITKYSEYYGLIKLNFEDVNGRISLFINYDGDSFNFFSKELNEGVLIDYFEEDGSFFYEILRFKLPNLEHL